MNCGRNWVSKLGLLLGLASGCGGGAPPAATADSTAGELPVPSTLPAPLVSPTEIGSDFTWRQRIEVRYQESRHELQAVVSHTGGTLKVLFLTPFGTRALLLEQRGRQVTVRYFVDRRLPFPPRYILDDIHRALFRGFEGSDQRQDLVGKGRERLVDSYGTDGLRRRLVYRWQADPAREAPLLEVRYQPGLKPGQPPPRLLELNNPQRGYSMTVETLSQ